MDAHTISLGPAFFGEHARATSLARMASEASRCERCDLYRNAEQLVFGEGPDDAAVIFVGEQPGDREDRAGRPFVGPAGKVLDKALAEAGIERQSCYFTNAVKHFKFRPRGKRRLHQRPSAGEVQRCAWWLGAELDLLKPRLVVALGATALYALLGRRVRLTPLRGRILEPDDASPVLVTIHPSFLLRRREGREAEYGGFVDDLRRVKPFLEV